MSNRVTYTPEQQAAIRELPVYEDREHRAGGKRKPQRGRVVQGYVVGDPVGRTIASSNSIVYRAENAAGDVALVRSVGTTSQQKVWFHHIVPAEDIVAYTMWTSMLDRCFKATCGSFPAYGAKGIRVAELAWLPGGLDTAAGTADERAAAFANFRTWARYSFGGIPVIGPDGNSPNVSRPADLGNYGRHCKCLPFAQHAEEARAVKAKHRVVAVTKRKNLVMVRHAREGDYDGA
jgi:hypothetical protein